MPNVNYGNAAVDFETNAADPVSYVFQPIEGRKGWRMLAWPVQGGTVANYAAQNHVQGLATLFPGASPNVLLRYNSSTSAYVPATALTDPLASGRGQFWYHYDAADFPEGVVPAGSNFRARPYVLRAGGVEPQSDVPVSFADVSGAGGFVMAGNPFSLDFDVAGITQAGASSVGPLVYVWNPDAGTAGGYAVLDRNAANPVARRAAPMQGLFVEAVPPAPAPGTAVTFATTFSQASRVQSNTPILSRTAEQRVLGFDLSRIDGDDAVSEWTVARLAFVDGAENGRDAFDAGQPPAVDASSEARIAFVGADGRPQGQDSRPYDLVGAVEARLALRVAGRADGTTYRLTWPTMDAVPSEWALELRDMDTGTTVDLSTADHYDFVASAGDWSERFVVSVAARSTASEAGPAVARLDAPRPNPSTTRARLALSVDRAQPVRADLFDALGRRVAVVFDATVESSQDLVVDTSDLAPGLYVLRVTGDTFAETRTVTVSR